MKFNPAVTLDVLLADDDKDDRFFFKKALQQLNISTTLKIVVDGAELMAYLDQSETNLPFVLFMDLNMPCKNGIECLKEIKSDTRFRALPVVVYSTSLQDSVADMLYRQGAHYYLHKCDFAELPACISEVLSLLLKNPAQPVRNKFILNAATT